MTRLRAILFGLICAFPLSGGWISVAHAQIQSEQWSEIQRLSSQEGEATEASMLADSYGYVHAFWAETGFFDHDRSVIRYARFDGETWSDPVTVYASWPKVNLAFLTPYVDQAGKVHLTWSEGNTGPLYYTSAHMEEAFSAKKWQEPIRIDVEAFVPKMVIDSNGVIHLVYVNFYGEQKGLYYIRSENRGKAWSYPKWLDPDIPAQAAPRWLSVKLDSSDGIHLLWGYVDEDAGGLGRWVRYAHSLDRGAGWSNPVTVDAADEEAEELRAAGPVFAVDGSLVHIIWAGNEQTEREYVVSEDSGTTWSDPIRIFGELHGAAGDDMAVDSTGRVHFVGQIRYPMGIYHAIRSAGKWSTPELVYLIKETAKDEVEDQIGAHNLRLAVRSGNQLVMTFTSSPADDQAVLYTMHRTLGDIPALEPALLSAPVPSPRPTPTLAIPSPTPTARPMLPSAVPPQAVPYTPGRPILIGLAPVSLLLLGVLAFRFATKR